MVTLAWSLGMGWLLPLHPYPSTISSMFLTFSLIFSLLVQSRKHYFALFNSFLIIVFFKTCRWDRGLVWVERWDMACMNLFQITHPLHFLVCHRRLRCPNVLKLWKALPLITINVFNCDSCEMGKHFRASYPRRDSLPSDQPFDLVHCDVWGPS